MIKKRVFGFILLFQSLLLLGQSPKQSYFNAFDSIEAMLNYKKPLSFNKSVFLAENVFLESKVSENDYVEDMLLIIAIIKKRFIKSEIGIYKGKDSLLVKQYASIFKTLTDTSIVNIQNKSSIFLPFRYNFEDMFGEKDWSNMFVTKLLATHKGNCHSMPYLYKILCDELGIPCHLALAPNHIYIKHRSEKVGWYNTELTSGSFPIDAWIMASGYIPLEAIQNGIYMDALDDKKCITLCVYDLAKGFDRKYPDNDGTFITKCCDLALEHFPNFINAMILKAETRKRQFERLMKAKNISTPKELRQQKEGKELWDDMNSLYAQIHKLGYRAMPEKMYVDWLVSLKKEREKYGNKQVMEMNKN